MDAALCEDEIGVLTPSGKVVQKRVSLARDGTAARLIPSHPWRAGEHRLVVSERLEDVCGNRLARLWTMTWARVTTAGQDDQLHYAQRHRTLVLFRQ
jgi:hypothetical protein